MATTQKPTLSVFLPTYNHASFLPHAVEALMSQSRPPDELLIIDDASTDQTPQIITNLSTKYPQLRSIRNPRNLGVVEIMKAVPEQLTGEYIYGAASDDQVLPGFFEEALNLAITHPQAGIIMGEIPTYDPDGNYLYTTGVHKWKVSRFATPKQFLEDCLESELASHSLSGATLYKRESLIALGGFRPELGSWLDTFALRALGLKHGACYLAQPCMAWRLSPNSVSQSKARAPRQLWETINLAATLMRSPEFNKIFPEPHVRRWLKRYRFIIAEQYVLARLGQKFTYNAARIPLIRHSRYLVHNLLGNQQRRY